jgi:hypothetical protein
MKSSRKEGVDSVEKWRETSVSVDRDEMGLLVARSPLAVFQRGRGEELRCCLWAFALHWP